MCPVLDSSSFVPVPTLKRQNPLLSYVRDREREREKLHCKCTMQCTVHCIITLFNVGNVWLCVIYQLNFTVFMYVTRISRYIWRSVLSAVSRNRGRSWNVLPVCTAALLFYNTENTILNSSNGNHRTESPNAWSGLQGRWFITGHKSCWQHGGPGIAISLAPRRSMRFSVDSDVKQAVASWLQTFDTDLLHAEIIVKYVVWANMNSNL
jgi:hypothetical protein